jgi:hypothetical protein
LKYIGNHSVDAELELDFEDGVINMDYTNSFYKGAALDSNRVLTLESKRLDVSKLRLVVYSIFRITFVFSVIAGFTTILNTFIKKFFNTLWIKYNLQYHYQCILKELVFMWKGFTEEFHTGELKSDTLIFNIPNNLYFEYELLGDYETNIKTIKLERRFVKKINPLTEKVQQHGWSVTFTFNEPPMCGWCKILYTN